MKNKLNKMSSYLETKHIMRMAAYNRTLKADDTQILKGENDSHYHLLSNDPSDRVITLFLVIKKEKDIDSLTKELNKDLKEVFQDRKDNPNLIVQGWTKEADMELLYDNGYRYHTPFIEEVDELNELKKAHSENRAPEVKVNCVNPEAKCDGCEEAYSEFFCPKVGTQPDKPDLVYPSLNCNEPEVECANCVAHNFKYCPEKVRTHLVLFKDNVERNIKK